MWDPHLAGNDCPNHCAQRWSLLRPPKRGVVSVSGDTARPRRVQTFMSWGRPQANVFTNMHRTKNWCVFVLLNRGVVAGVDGSSWHKIPKNEVFFNFVACDHGPTNFNHFNFKTQKLLFSNLEFPRAQRRPREFSQKLCRTHPTVAASHSGRLVTEASTHE